MSVTRRAVLSALPAGALSALLPELMHASFGQTPQESLPSAVFAFDKLEVHHSGAAEMRSILKGRLATGEAVEVHETTLPAGAAPHPPHRHEHSEMWLVREGTLEINIAGKTQSLGAGSAAFVRSNELHGVHNASEQRVTYFVVAVGPGAAG
ncbi:MAG TPA: cupin domain-containing protein [Candidatus Acidoferrum sp.]|nr:cupin domain-containing protein [Candidatus Acidoferrum sp.]